MYHFVMNYICKHNLLVLQVPTKCKFPTESDAFTPATVTENKLLFLCKRENVDQLFDEEEFDLYLSNPTAQAKNPWGYNVLNQYLCAMFNLHKIKEILVVVKYLNHVLS
jgi:hypothetical protein